MRSILAVVVLGVGTARADPVAEADLVRWYLDAPVATADREAVEARTRADRTAVFLLDAPEVQTRHEAARGPFGATTQALGGSATVDLGLSPLVYTRAGRLRGAAGDDRREAVVLASVCAVRADAADLWAANRSAEVSLAAQTRLEHLLQTFIALAEAGESSGYDRDRTGLAVGAQQTRTAHLVGAAAELRARLSTGVGGGPVDDVVLESVPDAPALDASVGQLASHPLLRALALERDAQRVATDAARLAQLPDLTLTGGRRWDAGPTGGDATPGFEVGGAVQIPLTDGSRAEARKQTAERAAAEARLARVTAELEARVRGAHRRVEALATRISAPPDPERVWESARDRYEAGESSLDDLLQVADAVEAARLAEVERERLVRRAHLDLSCAIGRFAQPGIQSVFEEAVR